MSAKVMKKWQYRGANLIVKHIRLVPKFEIDALLETTIRDETIMMFKDGHYCGYVETSEIVSKFEIDVHGGVTFYEENTDTVIYGFDCGHYKDTIDFWNLERVIKETERLADNILDWIK